MCVIRGTLRSEDDVHVRFGSLFAHVHRRRTFFEILRAKDDFESRQISLFAANEIVKLILILLSEKLYNDNIFTAVVQLNTIISYYATRA